MKIIAAINKTDESTNDMSSDKAKREIKGISMGGKHYMMQLRIVM